MKVVLFDLPPMTRLGIATALTKNGDGVRCEIEETSDAASVATAARRRRVQLLILDPVRPGLNRALMLCRSLKRLPDPPHILAFSETASDRELLLCHLSGIDSFVSAQMAPDHLVSAARSTLHGQRVWLFQNSREAGPGADDRTPFLTPREREVLWMMSDRFTNKQIARHLSISPNTVKNHVAAILRKLGVDRRSELFAGAVPRHLHGSRR